MKTPLLLLAALTLASHAASAAPAKPCHAGAYQAEGGTLLALGSSAVRGSLRFRTSDGFAGRLYPAKNGGFEGGPGWIAPPPPVTERVSGTCGGAQVELMVEGKTRAFRRVDLQIADTTFTHDGIRFRGQLLAPPGREKAPLAVFVHGSNDTSAVDDAVEPRLLASSGLAVFLYDKRGTGGSGGKYTQDFPTLAADAAAAMAHARGVMGQRLQRAGFYGASQGGWVAPLAASRTPADFVIVGYGLAQSPSDEDGEEVQYNLRQAGFGAPALAAAREITDTTAMIVRSGYKSGFKELAALKSRYGKEPWFKAINGEYTQGMLSYPEMLIRFGGPMRDKGTSWAYDPMPTLRALKTPMLWVLAEEDAEAPSATTFARLQALQGAGADIDVAVYPGTDHGMIQFERSPAGRQQRRYAPSFIPLIAEWSKSGAMPPAPDARLYPSR